MRKIFLLWVILVLFVGCARVEDIETSVNKIVSEIEGQTINFIRTNNTKTYYKYYLPSGTSNLESESSYNILNVSGNKILMNLDINEIIAKEYYSNTRLAQSVYDLNDTVYRARNASINGIRYDLYIYEYDEDYLIFLEMNSMSFTSLIKLNYLEEILYNMFIIGLSIEVNDDLVINDFSSKDTIDYTQEAVDLFEIIIPSEGRLEELIKPN